MADAAARRWSVTEFFEWQARQSMRYELVDGFPVQMMGGARNLHDLIVVNVLASLRAQLRGMGCRPFTADGGVETKSGQIRRPDAGVDSGKWNPEAMFAEQPRLVIEVLSPTTRDFDTFGKLDEYKAITSLDGIMLVEPNAPQVSAWRRGDAGDWIEQIHEGLDARVEIAPIGVAFPLATIYEDIVFPITPRLVSDSRRPPGGA